MKIVKTPWYLGLGIRMSGKGMLYNVQGLHAVEINYSEKNKNKTVLIGTNDAASLKEYIEKSF